jgi:hypothetical protein
LARSGGRAGLAMDAIIREAESVTDPARAEYDLAKPWRLGCAVLALVLVLLAAVPIAYLGYHYLLRQAPALFTSPLQPAATEALCARLDLAGDPRCAGGTAYAYQFLPALRRRYPAGTPGAVVDAALGPYAGSCSGWISRGAEGDFQDCRYTLDGDRDLMLYVTQRKDPGAAAETALVWRTCSLDVRNGSLWNIYACDPPLSTGLLLVMSDHTFLSAPGFTLAFLAFDLLAVTLVILLRRPLGIAG